MTAPSRQEVITRLGQLSVLQGHRLEEGCSLIEDLHLNEVDILSLLYLLEGEFSVEIEYDAMENVHTVGDVVTLIISLLE